MVTPARTHDSCPNGSSPCLLARVCCHASAPEPCAVVQVEPARDAARDCDRQQQGGRWLRSCAVTGRLSTPRLTNKRTLDACTRRSTSGRSLVRPAWLSRVRGAPAVVARVRCRQGLLAVRTPLTRCLHLWRFCDSQRAPLACDSSGVLTVASSWCCRGRRGGSDTWSDVCAR